MTERYLEDFTVGQTFGSGWLRVDEEQIRRFASEFDPQPFHLDDLEKTRGRVLQYLEYTRGTRPSRPPPGR